MNTSPPPQHDHGLAFDLRTLVNRRTALGLFAGFGGATLLAACATEPTPDTASAGTTTGGSSASATPSASGGTTGGSSGGTTSSPSVTTALADCGVEIPQETAGPYPGDGSNGPNVLVESGIVRQDLTTSFGSATGSVEGIPLTVTMTLLDGADGCRPLQGAAVYAWHCDADGNYSLYSRGFESENWLRGVQEADANGQVTFTTVFPGAYPGRYPHIHFEVFRSLSDTSAAGQVVAVSQIALTAASCEAVYATAGYESSRRNFPGTPIDRDNVFGDDGGVHQLATMAGSVDAGYSAALNVTV